jgi:hypothetical protein
MTAPDTPPPDLRSAIARDLAPARPLPPPHRRALVLLPIALATVAAVPMLHFFRSDLAALGIARAWGLSVVEAIGGVVLVAAALRESVPGRSLSRAALAAFFAAGLALPFLVLSSTAQGFSLGAPAGQELSDGIYCFRTSLVAAVPSLAIAAILAARAFALRPGVTGALYGLGCGVIADAGLRLFCEFTAPSHFLPAHAGAVASAMVIGMCAAKLGTSRGTKKG